MHKCIPYANNNIFMMIRNWVLTGMGGTDKSVPYELPLQIPNYHLTGRVNPKNEIDL